MDIKDYISEIDSTRFGFKIAKVHDYSNRPEELLLFLKENGVKLVLSKVDSENLKLINTLENLKFCIKDIQVTYKYTLDNYIKINLPYSTEFIIREAQQGDISKLKKTASESFKNYGHYYADEKLNPIKCNEIYVDWLKRSFENIEIADKLFVAEHQGDIAGFLSFKIYNNDKFKYAAGGIGAVVEKYRNRDVFRMLTIEGLNWGKENKLDWEEHNVLITNYPVNSSFIKSGFKIYKSFVTMHHWIEE